MDDFERRYLATNEGPDGWSRRMDEKAELMRENPERYAELARREATRSARRELEQRLWRWRR